MFDSPFQRTDEFSVFKAFVEAFVDGLEDDVDVDSITPFRSSKLPKVFTTPSFQTISNDG